MLRPLLGREGRRRGHAIALALGWLLLVGAPVAADAPATLAETGLYSDFAAKIVAADVHSFSPQYPLWSDGALKRRWIALPAGSAIDASDPDAWVFPIGTRIWKEFSFARRIETRLMELLPTGEWLYASYRWNEDESTATLAPVRGVQRATESRPGVPYGIPSLIDCRSCHESGASAVLGFSALQLSRDRDPGGLHQAPLEEGHFDLSELVRIGLVVGLPTELVERAPRVRAETPIARAALGYLHGNCGHCHNPRSPIANLGLFLDVLADGTPDALASAVAHESHYRPTGTTIDTRIVPGEPGASLLVARVSSRDPARQMPPTGTHVVDEQAIALLTLWIAEDLKPAPASAGESIDPPLAPSSEIPKEEAP
ncbi:MAG: hypothetical protein KDB94_00110 [Acidobacteria bacterium]|nr:hypothetical protein [Acidobacteriota bacterium]